MLASGHCADDLRDCVMVYLYSLSSRSQLEQGHPEERKEQTGFTFSRYKLNLHLGRTLGFADDYRVIHRQGKNCICDSKCHFILWTTYPLSEKSQILKILCGLKHYWGPRSKNAYLEKISHDSCSSKYFYTLRLQNYFSLAPLLFWFATDLGPHKISGHPSAFSKRCWIGC